MSWCRAQIGQTRPLVRAITGACCDIYTCCYATGNNTMAVAWLLPTVEEQTVFSTVSTPRGYKRIISWSASEFEEERPSLGVVIRVLL
jgi:hypothetical protein